MFQTDIFGDKYKVQTSVNVEPDLPAMSDDEADRFAFWVFVSCLEESIAVLTEKKASIDLKINELAWIMDDSTHTFSFRNCVAVAARNVNPIDFRRELLNIPEIQDVYRHAKSRSAMHFAMA